MRLKEMQQQPAMQMIFSMKCQPENPRIS